MYLDQIAQIARNASASKGYNEPDVAQMMDQTIKISGYELMGVEHI